MSGAATQRAGGDCEPRCYRLVLEYDGTAFEGWQIQSGERSARTVQGELERALESIGCRRVRIRGAGRTDAGVHAMGQIASVQLESGFDATTLERALNARLPRDLAVLAADEVPRDWDALREARGKHYRYQVWNGRQRSPLRAARWHWVAPPLDVEAMGAAAAIFVGRHDFAAFQGAGSATATTIRTLEALDVSGSSRAEIRFDVRGEGFLRHMVRNLVGTLIEVGRGRWTMDRAAEILASCDRRLAGPMSPALGLVLVAVRDSWTETRSEAAPSVDPVDGGQPVG